MIRLYLLVKQANGLWSSNKEKTFYVYQNRQEKRSGKRKSIMKKLAKSLYIPKNEISFVWQAFTGISQSKRASVFNMYRLTFFYVYLQIFKIHVTDKSLLLIIFISHVSKILGKVTFTYRQSLRTIDTLHSLLLTVTY